MEEFSKVSKAKEMQSENEPTKDEYCMSCLHYTTIFKALCPISILAGYLGLEPWSAKPCLTDLVILELFSGSVSSAAFLSCFSF